MLFLRKNLTQRKSSCSACDMTKQEAYNLILDRLQKSENAQRPAEAAKEKGLGILWHLERAKDMLRKIPEASEPLRTLYEDTLSVSIRDILKMMDEQGWA